MNPIAIFFRLVGRQADIRRALAIYGQIKDPLTELIDIIRSLMADVGLLGSVPGFSETLLSGYDTKWVQESLNRLGANLTIDGNLGPATVEAVKKFQEKHPPLKVDGSPGVQTAAALAAELDKLDNKRN